MCCFLKGYFIAGWSSPVARQAHNLKVVGSNPAPATNGKAWICLGLAIFQAFFVCLFISAKIANFCPFFQGKLFVLLPICYL